MRQANTMSSYVVTTELLKPATVESAMKNLNIHTDYKTLLR